MTEARMRRKIVRLLKPLDAVSVENPAYPGTPDINYVDGWIELKWLRSAPLNSQRVLRVPCLTQQQRVWLRRRWRAGGNAYLLLQVGDEWFLIEGELAADCVGRVRMDVLGHASTMYWQGTTPDQGELIECLDRNRQERPAKRSPSSTRSTPKAHGRSRRSG